MENLKQNPQNNNNEGTKLNRRDFLAGLTIAVLAPNMATASIDPTQEITDGDRLSDVVNIYDAKSREYIKIVDELIALVGELAEGENITYADFEAIYDKWTELYKAATSMYSQAIESHKILEELPLQEGLVEMGRSFDSIIQKMPETYMQGMESLVSVIRRVLDSKIDYVDAQDRQDIESLLDEMLNSSIK